MDEGVAVAAGCALFDYGCDFCGVSVDLEWYCQHQLLPFSNAFVWSLTRYMALAFIHFLSAYTALLAAPPPPITNAGLFSNFAGSTLYANASLIPMTSVLVPMYNRFPEASCWMKSVLTAPTSLPSSVRPSRCFSMATLCGIVTEAPALLLVMFTRMVA